MANAPPDQTIDWTTILNSLMSGIAHQISNRVAVLSGISDLLAANAAIPAPILQALTSEVPKLEEAIRLLRLLPSADEPLEATEPIRLVNDAIALATLHPDLKNLSYTTATRTPVPPPILARPTALTHEILTAIVHAANESSSDRICVYLEAVGSNVLITVGRYSVPAQMLVSARQPTSS